MPDSRPAPVAASQPARASRRSFFAVSAGLAAAVSASAASSLKPAVSAKSAARVLGANDRIRVAAIGTGGKGTSHLRMLAPRAAERKDIEMVAVADVYTRYRDRARDICSLGESDGFVDYRKMLERSGIDAVFIATPDHWHGQMAIDCMATGRDVYLEKPYTLTIEEARDVSAAVKQQKRVLQVGSQHLSDRRYHAARELVQAGEIGTPLWAQTTYSRNSLTGEWNYYVEEEASPRTIDWKRWLGSAPPRPFSAERYFRWRKYWDYSGGIATDLFYHRIGPLLFVMGSQYPTRVSASGGIYQFRDREVPDTYATTVEYPDFYITAASSMANQAGNRYLPPAIYGHKGTITFEREGVRVLAEPLFAGEKSVLATSGKLHGVDDGPGMAQLHHDNFFDSMRARKQPVLNEDLALEIMTAIKLGVDSYRQGKTFAFDPQSRAILPTAPPRPAFEGTGENPPDGRKKRG
ncbi:MAG: Gfo/Idh/MocA family oxidoreductase [Bryobacterales bacterium]|nr:Gfo/Idh/MocA family oxidoreductase [Bryobacterales bacterium]